MLVNELGLTGWAATFRKVKATAKDKKRQRSSTELFRNKENIFLSLNLLVFVLKHIEIVII